MYCAAINPCRINYKNSPASRPNFTGKVLPEQNFLAPKLKEIIGELYKRAERGVSEYGHFEPVQVKFQNPDKSIFAGQVTLKIEKATDLTNPNHMSRRYLHISVASPKSATSFSEILKKGNKMELLEMLQSGKFAEDAEIYIRKVASELKDESFRR